MIEVKNLTKMYDGHLAVDHLNFTMEKDRIYGFLGPNGAGKSTTMNMLTGYLAATEGSITINGFDIQEDPEEARKCIGYLPELPPLYTGSTVLEYLRFAAELKKIPGKERTSAIEEAMKVSGIEDVKDRLIRNLSKGYRQRVGLAQAILGLPDIIILDEPTVGLDPIQMIEMRDTIRSLAKGHTVLLSSHILSEVSAICDHIIIISHGKMVASGTPQELAEEMEGNLTLNLVVKGTKENLDSALSSIPEIRSCRISESVPTEGFLSAEIATGKSADIHESLFYALAEKKLPIYSMQSTSRSLEDIFIELTEAEKNDMKDISNIKNISDANNKNDVNDINEMKDVKEEE